jgi:light-regulated signal transduction histidine kinase (bacteriophytochrome)
MGVGASLSISIIVEGKLWGLFACHHYAPRLPTFAQRSAAELFGQIFSMMLESRERAQTAEYEGKARQVADRLLSAVAQDHDLLTNARWLGDIIFDTIPADGVGVYIDGQMTFSGLAPDAPAFVAIVSMLNRVAASQVYTTDNLSSVLPAAAAYADRVSGVLAIPLSRRPRDYVVLFRAEQLRSVRWAGNPEKEIWAEWPAPDPAQKLRILVGTGEGRGPALPARRTARGRSAAHRAARSHIAHVRFRRCGAAARA